ncbi:hypothetical protein VTG60DRAFT_3861 [Thermothelomyces hinnuleus]
MAICIDDRIYKRKQQKKGYRQVFILAKANDKKKRTYESMSYGIHPGAIDVDVAQKQDKKKTVKDKSNITCYNYRKKGHYKRECRTSKKKWQPVPGAEIAKVDQDSRSAYEVVVASYSQDNLEDAQDQVLAEEHDQDGASKGSGNSDGNSERSTLENDRTGP